MSKQITIPYIHCNSAGTEKREHKNKSNITRMQCAMNPLTLSLPSLPCTSHIHLIPSLQGLSVTSPLEPPLPHLNA